MDALSDERCGASADAVAALRRAAGLSPTNASKAPRLAVAAYSDAGMVGGLSAAPAAVRAARRPDPDSTRSPDAAVTTAYVLLNSDGDIDTSHRILVDAPEAASHEASATVAVIEIPSTLCQACFLGGRRELWQPLDAAIDRLGEQTPSSPELSRRLYGDPAHAVAPTIERLDDAINGLYDEPDPAKLIKISTASLCVDRPAGCRPGLRRIARNGLETGEVATTVQAAELLAFEAYFEGRPLDNNRQPLTNRPCR